MTAYILTRRTGNSASCEVIRSSFVAAETRSSLFNAVGRLCVRGFSILAVLRDENLDTIGVDLSSAGTTYSYRIVKREVEL